MKLEGEIIVSQSSPGIFVAAKQLDYVVGLAGLETFKAKGNRYKIIIEVPDIEAKGTIPDSDDGGG